MIKHAKGFSLVELMIAIGIVGFLTAVALGFYGDNVTSANRTEARGALTATAASLEKCKSLNGNYGTTNCSVGLPFDTDEALYVIDTSVRNDTQFTLTATPKVGEGQANDADCTELSLTNTGVKAATGADPTVCWN